MFSKCILIPARGGSKGIPKKNLYALHNKPLIYYPIHAASNSCIEEIYVSTDCEEIATASRLYGAEVISRPPQISGDLSTDLEVFQHFIKTSKTSYDYIVHLRATFPKITGEIINEVCQKFENSFSKADSLRSVIQSKENPYKMWHIKKNYLRPVIPANKFHSSPRQIIESSYTQNACIDIVKVSTIREKKSMVGDYCLAHQMSSEYDYDIDTIEDIERRKW